MRLRALVKLSPRPNCSHSCQSDNLAQLPGGRDLPLGDYSNITKGIRRALKQLGRGSVTDGVLAAKNVESVAAKELASILEVGASWLVAAWWRRGLDCCTVVADAADSNANKKEG
jgi:hypothetical protein